MLRRISLSAGTLAAVVAIAGCGSSATPQQKAVSASLAARALPPIKLPAYVPGPLNGLSTPRARALRRPISIILENYAPDSRPQSGLSQASLVIETLAEGGVTRFLATYLEGDATKIGPVRSTRMYFDYWAAGLHSILVHVGGNDDAQNLLWHLPRVFNIDENRWEKSLFDTGTPLFWRSHDRQAPHNMYTSTYKLRAYAVKNRENWVYTQASMPHKQQAALKSRGHKSTISINFENPLDLQDEPAYDVQYVYDRASNTYLRRMGGAPHIDSNTGRPLRPANVVILKTGRAVADPFAGPTPESILIPVRAQGVAWYFEDGHVSKGVWRKAQDPNSPLMLLNGHGKPQSFNPGQTWIEVAPAGSPTSWTVR